MRTVLFSAMVMLLAAPIVFADTIDAISLVTGSTSVTYLDNGACIGTGGGCSGLSFADTNPSLGVITTSGAIGGWTITSISATLSAGLTLTTDVSCPSGACTPLDVQYSAIDFDPLTPPTSFSVGYSGTLTGTGGSTSQSAYYDLGNSLFAETRLIATIGPFLSPTTFGSSAAYPVTVSSVPYSLTLDQLFTGAGGTAVGFDPQGQITATPEPASLGLLGTILAFCVVRLRRGAR